MTTLSLSCRIQFIYLFALGPSHQHHWRYLDHGGSGSTTERRVLPLDSSSWIDMAPLSAAIVNSGDILILYYCLVGSSVVSMRSEKDWRLGTNQNVIWWLSVSSLPSTWRSSIYESEQLCGWRRPCQSTTTRIWHGWHAGNTTNCLEWNPRFNWYPKKEKKEIRY